MGVIIVNITVAKKDMIVVVGFFSWLMPNSYHVIIITNLIVIISKMFYFCSWGTVAAEEIFLAQLCKLATLYCGLYFMNALQK